MEPNQVLRWIECHPGLAAYVQAAGVIVTLAIASFGPPLTHRLERVRERRGRTAATVALAKHLLPSVHSLVERIDGRLATVDTYDQPAAQDWGIFFDNMMIEIPGALDLSLRSDVDIDTARLSFLRNLVEQMRKYNLSLADKRMRGVRDGEWRELQKNIRDALTNARKSADQATSTIRSM